MVLFTIGPGGTTPGGRGFRGFPNHTHAASYFAPCGGEGGAEASKF